jgi:HlyD family secretion protein
VTVQTKVRNSLSRTRLRRRIPRRLLIPAILAVVLTFGLIAFMFLRPAAKTETVVRAPVATVTTHVVSAMPITQTISASGTIWAVDPIDIGSEVSGVKVEALYADEGQYVRRGQVLARLNSSVLAAQLQREQAHLQGAVATYQKSRQPNRIEDIRGLRAALLQAQAAVSQEQANLQRSETNLKNLKQTAQRYSMLRSEGAISTQESEDRDAAARMAESEVNAARDRAQAAKYAVVQARERLQLAESGGRSEDIAMSASEVGQIRATIQQIEAQIEQTIIRAPDDGLITKRDVELGEIASVGTPMFSMARGNQLEVRVQVPEVDLPRVQPGNPASILPAASELAPVHARVRQISPLVDAQTRMGTVYVQVPASSGLKQGMFVRTVFETGSKAALAVPTKAVMSEAEGKVVFVVEGDQARRRVVQLGTINGDFAEIVSGLQAGDKVIVAGAGFLKDGDIVRLAQ